MVRRWAALSIGGGHAAGVSGSGECFAWGRNDRGQLGAPASAELQPVPARIGILRGWDVRAISCGCAPGLARLRGAQLCGMPCML